MSNPKLTPRQLEEIRQRAEKATKGPWTYDLNLEIDEPCASFCTRGSTNPRRDISHEQAEANCVFAAHARADIPALLEHVKELEGKLKAAESDLWHALNNKSFTSLVVGERDSARREVEELKSKIRVLQYRNLTNAVNRICVHCGHEKTEDGCPHCIQQSTALNPPKESKG
jgi:hypothetical protein